MNWQPITQDNPPKAPCFLGRLDSGETYRVYCRTDREIGCHGGWTHWIPFPNIQPAKHPAEAAFEEWWRKRLGYENSPDASPSSHDKAVVRWAFQHAAETMCEVERIGMGGMGHHFITVATMRDRLLKAAESIPQ